MKKTTLIINIIINYYMSNICRIIHVFLCSIERVPTELYQNTEFIFHISNLIVLKSFENLKMFIFVR